MTDRSHRSQLHVSMGANRAVETDARQERPRAAHRERYFGRVARVFRLGTEIDQSGATAKYADDVIELALPKKTAAAGRQLAIQ